LRYCTLENAYPEFHAPSHAIDNEPSRYAARSFEIYHNVLTSTGTKTHYGLGRIRASTGVIWSNEFHRTGGTNTYSLIFDYEPEAAGDTGMSHPAPMQPGTGRWSGTPSVYNCSVGGTWPAQEVEPIYCWDNTIDSGNWYIITSSQSLIQAERDVYLSTQKSGYTPYTYPHPLRGEGNKWVLLRS